MCRSMPNKVSVLFSLESPHASKRYESFHPRVTRLASPSSIPKQAPLVKICGITTEADAIAAADAGADMLGLNFVPTSKRLITLDKAQAISSAVRSRTSQTSPLESTDSASVQDELTNKLWFAAHAGRLSSTLPNVFRRPLLVGVFQNQPLSFILHAVATTQLDIVQLHGSEPVEWASIYLYLSSRSSMLTQTVMG